MPSMTNHVAAAQSPMFVVMAGDIAYENAKSPAIFFQFLKNYSRDLRDDQKRLIPLLGCLGNHEVRRGLRQDAQGGPLLLFGLRRPLSGDGLCAASTSAITCR